MHMEINIQLDERTENILMEISNLKKCSINQAAAIVLERYAERTKSQIESAHKAADSSLTRYK